ncbi:MAG: NAD(P)H-hydrate dehydratase [Patescibacteria group bacterium]
MKPIEQDKLLFPEILAPRPKEAHKKSVGSVMIVAGSDGMSGAATLCSEATMRAGAGIVLLAFPKSLSEIYTKLIPEVLTLPCDETKEKTLALSSLDKILEEAKKYDVILIGPGLSQNNETRKLICELFKNLKNLHKNVVLDADGLNAIAGQIELLEKLGDNKTILLPHAGEMARLTNKDVDNIQRDREWLVRKKAKEWKCVLVIKGYETVISDGERVIINKSGGPELATAGTGDALAGMVAAHFAGNVNLPFEATATAVYLHGLAGDMVSKKLGERSVLATDVINMLPEVIKKVLNKLD